MGTEDELAAIEEMPESVPAETEQEQAATAPKYLTADDLAAIRADLKREVQAEATEHGRRGAQSWLDKHNARQAAIGRQADDMVAELGDAIADEDRPAIRDRMARKLMETMPASEPDEPSIPEPLKALVRAHGLNPDEPELHPSRFPTQEAFFAELVRRGDASREAARHNPKPKAPAGEPVMQDVGSSGGAVSAFTLLARYSEACERGDVEEIARLEKQIK